MKTVNRLLGVSALATVLGAGVFAIPAVSVAADAKALEEGKALAFDRKKGNCLACHMIAGGVSPGNIGPPLIAMKARFPDPKVVHDRIYDPQKFNPETTMPPFGKHGALSEDEINKIVDFVMTL
ncbi:MAG: sulfur oxidation c-type cytochrome SoxX [Gammaproteobacteria bacterium]